MSLAKYLFTIYSGHKIVFSRTEVTLKIVQELSIMCTLGEQLTFWRVRKQLYLIGLIWNSKFASHVGQLICRRCCWSFVFNVLQTLSEFEYLLHCFKEVSSIWTEYNVWSHIWSRLRKTLWQYTIANGAKPISLNAAVLTDISFDELWVKSYTCPGYYRPSSITIVANFTEWAKSYFSRQVWFTEFFVSFLDSSTLRYWLIPWGDFCQLVCFSFALMHRRPVIQV